MAVVLALVFRSRLRLLPLAVALAAVAITFGAMSLLGASLTMASIAVLPVLLGLGVDYAIQYQARVEEAEREAGGGTVGGGRAHGARRRCRRSPPPALATAVGFLVLLLSPVPMVRGFGVLLVVGIAIALFLALSAGTAALVAAGRRRGSAGALAQSARGAAELVDGFAARVGRAAGPLRRLGGRVWERVLRGGLERPKRVLLIGLGDRAGRAGGRLADAGQLRPARARAAGPARRRATSTRCSARPAWRARSTSSSRARTSPTRPS